MFHRQTEAEFLQHELDNLPEENRRKIQISDLRQKQRKVYDIVAEHFKNTRKNKQQFYDILTQNFYFFRTIQVYFFGDDGTTQFIFCGQKLPKTHILDCQYMHQNLTRLK